MDDRKLRFEQLECRRLLTGGDGLPYVLDQPDTTYVLDEDIVAAGTAVRITAGGITLDLNGHTITYDDFPSGLPNADFELGESDVPFDWDLTGAPAAKRTSTYDCPVVNRWYLKLENPQSDQAIISPWIDLPQSHEATAYFARKDRSWEYLVYYTLEVEHETKGIVASFTDATEYSLDFTTSSVPGRYRLKLTYIHNDWSQAAAWQPDWDYSVGDIIIPTTPNDHVYQAVSDVGLSGGIEPDWPTWYTSTTDGNMSWLCYAYSPSDLHVDLLDLRPTHDHAIEISAGIDHNGITIENGNIIQGRGGGFRSHAIFCFDHDLVTVKNMYIENWGVEAAAMRFLHSDGHQISDNTIYSDSSHTYNRHQLSAPITLISTSDSRIEGNAVYADTGWGTVFVSGGDNNVVCDNVLKTKSVIVNHHAVIFYDVDDSLIYNNTIEADPGQGILLSLGCSENEVFENEISIMSAAPDWFSGRYCLDAIRLNDYRDPAGAHVNNRVHDNVIRVTGKQSEYYEPETQLLNGISAIQIGSGNVYENNDVKATIVDPELIVSGVMSGSTIEPIVWRNNRIESDVCNVLFGKYPTYSLNSHFISNTFVKGAGAIEGYVTLKALPKVPEWLTNTNFVDSTLDGGASLAELDVPWHSTYSYYVDWRLNAVVKDNSGTIISGANVEIMDRNDNVVFMGLTGQDGRIDGIQLNEYEHYGEGTSATASLYDYSTPHTLVVSASGFETLTEVVTMDGSKTLVLGLDASGPVPGDANRDGIVDDRDAAILATFWQMQEGATWEDGDFNADGLVNDADATILASTWRSALTRFPHEASAGSRRSGAFSQATAPETQDQAAAHNAVLGEAVRPRFGWKDNEDVLGKLALFYESAQMSVQDRPSKSATTIEAATDLVLAKLGL